MIRRAILTSAAAIAIVSATPVRGVTRAQTAQAVDRADHRQFVIANFKTESGVQTRASGTNVFGGGGKIESVTGFMLPK